MEVVKRQDLSSSVSRKRLASGEVSGASVGGGVERETIERSAEGLLVGHGARGEWSEAAEPDRVEAAIKGRDSSRVPGLDP
jgi:hypothetical protein